MEKKKFQFEKIHAPHVHSSTIHNSQRSNPDAVSRCRDRDNVVHRDSGISLSHKKDGRMPFVVTCMDLQVIMLSEVSLAEKTDM